MKKIKNNTIFIMALAAIIVVAFLLSRNVSRATNLGSADEWERGIMGREAGTCSPSSLNECVYLERWWILEDVKGYQYYGFEVDDKGVCTGSFGVLCQPPPPAGGESVIVWTTSDGYKMTSEKYNWNYIYNCYDESLEACKATLPCDNDGECDVAESTRSCPSDCPDGSTVYGCINENGVCEPGESAISCPDCETDICTTCGYGSGGGTDNPDGTITPGTPSVVPGSILQKSISMEYSDWKVTSTATRLLTLCKTDNDCMPYESLEDPEATFKLKCSGTSQIITKLKVDAETFCDSQGGKSWTLVAVGGAGCLAGMVATAAGTIIFAPTATISVPLTVSLCSLGAAGGAIGGALVNNAIVVDCESKTIGTQGACIASRSNADVCTYLESLNVFGMSDPCMGGAIVALILVVVIYVFATRLSQPPKK